MYQLTFSDIGACNLKKGLFFNPDPYVKFRICTTAEDIVAPAGQGTELGYFEEFVRNLGDLVSYLS